ncbi:hypothetical protein [Bradyrhizobium sp. SZCCHNR2028]|uniref:hypothetical protein n=1 Tax=Bradyrhizobium sp. SZCCHNR2028 TaxID=3057382 RepID=UPI0028E873A3|nr:hypothetical protein [Bradyrhizobium sp. SZCCHNR2028]
MGESYQVPTDFDEMWKTPLAVAKLEIFDRIKLGRGDLTFDEHVSSRLWQHWPGKSEALFS